MFFIVSDPFFSLGVELSVTAMILICEGIHVLAEHLFQVLEGSKDLRFDIFGVKLRVIREFVFEDLAGVSAICRVVTDHLLENILEEDRRGHLAVNFPEVLLALENQLLVVWVVRMGPTEGLVFHFQ